MAGPAWSKFGTGLGSWLLIGRRVTNAVPQAAPEEITIANHIQRAAHTVEVDNSTSRYAGGPVHETSCFTLSGYRPTI